MVDRRVAQALIAAVYATDRHISISEVAFAAHRAGLTPRDVDNVHGADALSAVALSVRRSTPDRIDTALPESWRGAVEAALDHLFAKNATPRQRRAIHWRLTVRQRRGQSLS
jgi:hypothetical protein